MLLAARAWSPSVAAALAVAVAILVTGAFHEDGLADTADGLGGGQDTAARLAIMKDSRIGSYGALALAISLIIKIAALGTIPPAMVFGLLVFGHGAARFAAVIPMALLPYAGDPAQSKYKPTPERVRVGEVAVAMVITLWPLAFVSIVPAVLGAFGGIVLAKILALTARRLVGGQTGDILGAIEQLFELGFILGAAAAVRHGL
jgi:adenosylcobinamide-GDP ribazoletransferase